MFSVQGTVLLCALLRVKLDVFSAQATVFCVHCNGYSLLYEVHRAQFSVFSVKSLLYKVHRV